MAHLRNDGSFAQGRSLRKPKRCHIHHRLFQVGRKGQRDAGRVGRGPEPRCSLTETVPIWGRGAPRGVSGCPWDHPGVCRATGGDKKEAARGGAAPPRVGAERSGAGGGGAALSCPHAPPRTHTHTHTRSHPPTHTHTRSHTRSAAGREPATWPGRRRGRPLPPPPSCPGKGRVGRPPQPQPQTRTSPRPVTAPAASGKMR